MKLAEISPLQNEYENIFVYSRGESKEAFYVAEMATAGLSHLRNSNTFGWPSNELHEVFMECSEENWDGFDAIPVSTFSYDYAMQFLKVLPVWTEAPSFGAEADGQMTMEWYRSPRRVLSISFSPDGRLYYAALLGENRAYGTEVFFGKIPESILILINKVTAN